MKINFFLGDTLFLGGCGRFFEGTAEQMHKALIDILGNLPEETKVFCGHEYTLQNLKFAAYVEPKNEHIKNKIEWSKQRRQEGKPTVRNLSYLIYIHINSALPRLLN